MYTRLNLKDRLPANPGRRQLVPVAGQANTYDMTLADNPTQAGDKVNAAVFKHFEDALIAQTNLLSDAVQGAIAYPTFVNGQVTEIDHKNGSTVIRTDVFTYSTNLITEVRTLLTGETVTFKYHTDTLETEVI